MCPPLSPFPSWPLTGHAEILNLGKEANTPTDENCPSSISQVGNAEVFHFDEVQLINFFHGLYFWGGS